MKKRTILIPAAAVLAVLILALVFIPRGEKLLDLFPDAEWTWMVGGPAQFDTPGADVFAVVQLRNHPSDYDIPAKIQDATMEAVLDALKNVRVKPAKEGKLPEGNFYMYGFRFHDDGDNAVGITICENGLIAIRVGDGYDYTYYQASPRLYKQLRSLFGDIRDFRNWKK